MMTDSLNSCDCIVDRLYLGDRNSASDMDLIKKLKVSHVLTAESCIPPMCLTSRYPKMAMMFLKIADQPDADMLGSIESCIRFVRQGMAHRDEEGGRGGVLVHCYHGISRSATVVAGYLMKTRRLSYEEALSLIQQARPQACPNEGFEQQLRLYHAMGWKLDSSLPAFKCYRLKTIQLQTKKTKILPAEVQRFRDNVVHAPSSSSSRATSTSSVAALERNNHLSRNALEGNNRFLDTVDHVAQVVEALRIGNKDSSASPVSEETVNGTSSSNGSSHNGDSGSCGSGDNNSVSTVKKAPPPLMQPPNNAVAMMKANKKLYRCKKCRTILMTHANIIPHSPFTKELTWTGLLEGEMDKKTNKAQINECKLGVFVEPVRWMDQAFMSVYGRLNCQRCRAKLGHFHWNDDVSCACGCFTSPGFVVNLARVDVCTMLKDVEDADL